MQKCVEVDATLQGWTVQGHCRHDCWEGAPVLFQHEVSDLKCMQMKVSHTLCRVQEKLREDICHDFAGPMMILECMLMPRHVNFQPH